MYLWFVFNKTLLDRKIGADNNFKLVVKLNWLFIRGDKEDLVEGIENVIFFIPYSFFLIKSFYRKYRWNNIVIIMFITSLIIEILQFIFKIGSFQLSDLFHNILGEYIDI